MRKIKHYKGNPLDFHEKVVNSKRNTKNDVGKKKRLAALLPTSQKAFADYDVKFARNVLQTLIPIKLTNQEKEDYIGLYDFHSSVFTRLFNRLTTTDEGVDDSMCPYCTIGEASSLDHIIPKTVMPVFADHPKNLIPCCSNCNSKKSNVWFADNNWDYINLYLDDLPDVQFLFVDFTIDNNTLKVNFHIDNRKNIDRKLFLKIFNHYTKLDLCRRFELYCNQEISEVAILIKSFSKCVADDKCKEVILESSKELQNEYGFNYWKAVLRAACCTNDAVFQFLKTI